MEGSRTRTILGLGLVLLGSLLLLRALAAPSFSMRIATPVAPIAAPAKPAIEAMPAKPAMPAMPAKPAMPSLPPAPHFLALGKMFSPATVLLILLALIVWRRQSVRRMQEQV